MRLKKAARIMYEAHSSGQAVVKRCHKELAELYKERHQEKGPTVSLARPAG
jgi:ATP-dependent Clp protease adaptor protein ClpS